MLLRRTDREPEVALLLARLKLELPPQPPPPDQHRPTGLTANAQSSRGCGDFRPGVLDPNRKTTPPILYLPPVAEVGLMSGGGTSRLSQLKRRWGGFTDPGAS